MVSATLREPEMVPSMPIRVAVRPADAAVSTAAIASSGTANPRSRIRLLPSSTWR